MIAEHLAKSYLKSLRPDQIRDGLPKWLEDLTPEQFAAAFEVAMAEALRRGMMPVNRAPPASLRLLDAHRTPA